MADGFLNEIIMSFMLLHNSFLKDTTCKILYENKICLITLIFKGLQVWLNRPNIHIANSLTLCVWMLQIW